MKERIEKLLEKGEELAKVYEYKQALEYFKAVLELDPGSKAALEGKKKCESGLGLVTGAGR